MLLKSRRHRKSPRSRRGRVLNPNAASAMSRGVVMLSICAGAGMWGYAMFNLAT